MTDTIFGGRTEMPAAAEARVSKQLYLSPEVARLEAERLWPRVWQVVGRREEIPEVGDYVEYSVGRESFFIIRVDHDTIKAYFNVCMHRGARLKTGCANAKEIRCPYHSWRWNLDGSIKEVVDAYDFDPEVIEPDKIRLKECRFDTWGGFLFINPDGQAPPLLEWLGPIPDERAPWRIEDMRTTSYRSTVINANWKTALHAFAEGYHTSGTHPQLLFYMDDTAWPYEICEDLPHGAFMDKVGANNGASLRFGDLRPGTREFLRTRVSDRLGMKAMSPAEAKSALADIDSLDDDAEAIPYLARIRRAEAKAQGIDISHFTDGQTLGESADWCIFPNLAMPFEGPDMRYRTFRPNGLDPNTCFVDNVTLHLKPEGKEPPKVERQFFPDYRDHDWGRVLMQDYDNIANTQNGMHSSGFDDIICGRQDLLVWHHLRWVEKYINGGV